MQTDERETRTARWHVIWTRSNCEQLAYESLTDKGFELFLPMLDRWTRRRGARCLKRVPMFPGYMFVRHAIDKWSYIDLCNTKGVVRLLGESWDRLATVPDREIDAIRAVAETGLPRMPHPYLETGQRVRVTHGQLANVEGILVERDPQQGLLVLSVELLRRSVAVQIDCTQAVPA